jgi:mono/diheme cytochrome c family protein
MKKPTYFVAGALSLVSAGLLVTAMAVAEENERGERGEGGSVFFSSANRGVPAVKNEQYRTECGACHMAYSPGLLPARSWEKMMGGLDNHFGDNAELAPETAAAITKYLVDNAADKVDYRRSGKINNSIAAKDTPLRISETPYFVAKHDEVPARMVKNNPKVKSWANCVACHGGAEEGNFNEHEVRIPGFEKSHH